MIDAHPALVAASPQAPVMDWFLGDDWHHNGAFFLAHAFRFLAQFHKLRPENLKKLDAVKFDYGTPDGYDFFLEMGPLSNADALHLKGENPFWKELMAHGTYDAFWKARDLRRHVKGIRPAVLTVGGWFDAENLFGALETFKRVEATGVPKGGNHLVMGPWRHGGWARDDGSKLGDVAFNSKTAEYYREKIELPFFEYHLKGKGDGKFPKAWVFETGTNVWRKFDAWPPEDREAAGLRPGRRRLARRRGTGRERPRGGEADGVRRVRLRPGEAGPLHRQAGEHDGAPSTRRRTSGSPRAGPTCSSTRPRCWPRT